MILIIDDDAAVRSSLTLTLKRAGYLTAGADGPRQALDIAAQETPELFVMDMNFSVATSGEEGLALLKDIRSRFPDRPVILITAWGSIPLAVEGMKAGAVDFITKPWNNERFLQSVATALGLSRSEAGDDDSSLDRDKLNERYDFGNIIGADETLLSVLNTAGRVAATDAPVLIMGESGVGKELIAEAIHANSPRRDGPFVKVNLGGISSALFESEMFGHKKGAFTDAVRDRVGRFEVAHGGTIFLDEIGDLDLSSQVKLLRVLQDGAFEALGASRTQTSDFRVICATNRDLAKMVTLREFREDLYYRINLVNLRLPPLRERQSDIPILARFFVDNLAEIYGRDSLAVNRQAMNWLREAPWPGNVRELKNLVERTVLITEHDNLELEDFAAQTSTAAQKLGPAVLPAVGAVTIDEMEKSMIEKALKFHDGNVSRVARSLGLSRGALYRRLEKHGLGL